MVAGNAPSPRPKHARAYMVEYIVKHAPGHGTETRYEVILVPHAVTADTVRAYLPARGVQHVLRLTPVPVRTRKRATIFQVRDVMDSLTPPPDDDDDDDF